MAKASATSGGSGGFSNPNSRQIAFCIWAFDKLFYEGKVAAAQFFARSVLPKLAAERAIAESTDLALMDLAEEAF